jgi:hypothetical protein
MLEWAVAVGVIVAVIAVLVTLPVWAGWSKKPIRGKRRGKHKWRVG